MKSYGGDGTVGPRSSEGKPHGRCRDLGKTGCSLSLASAIQRQPTPCEQLEAVRPPAAGDERQLLAAGRGEEQLQGLVRLPGFQQRTREPHGSPGRDEAFVEVTGEVDALGGAFLGSTWSQAWSDNPWAPYVYEALGWDGKTWGGKTWGGTSWGGKTWGGKTWG